MEGFAFGFGGLFGVVAAAIVMVFATVILTGG